MLNIVTIAFTFLMAALTVALLGDSLIKVLTKIGFRQIIRQEGPSSHKTKELTPTAGGLVFLIVIPLIFIILFCTQIFSLEEADWSSFFQLSIVLVLAMLIGFWDDYLKKVQKQNEGLKPKQKLVAQIALAVLVVIMLNRDSTNIFGYELSLGTIGFVFFVFLVLAGSMNAANLTDGLDGLASSVLAWSFLGLGALILLSSGPFVASLYAFAMAGVCFGFLQINGHPAKVFMGDTGSFLLGGSLAALALFNNLEWFLLPLALVPIWETLSVMIQVISCKLSKKFLGKDLRPFKMTPFHHHLELSGIQEQKVVLIMSAAQALVSLLTCIGYFLLMR